MSVIDGFILLTCSVAQKGTASEPRSKTVLGRRFALDQAKKMRDARKIGGTEKVSADCLKK